MSFPKYPAYKDSGVEWLGDVPEHWRLAKFSRHFRVRMGETIPEGELCDDGWLPVYSATEEDKYYGHVSSRRPLAEKGDLIIPARGNSIGHVKLVREPATGTQTTIVACNINPSVISGKFAYYWATGLREVLFHFDRTAIPQITTEYVSTNRIVVPDKEEQDQIARFLDHETAKIDALIQEQQRLIELLKEKRQAVISHAVTKGLDPSVPMKDSGVEWLGEVPEHWTLRKASYLGRLFGADGVPEDLVVDTGSLPFLKVGSLSAESNNVRSWDWFVDESIEHQYRPPSRFIVFPKRGAAIFLNKVNVVNRSAVIDPNLMGWEIAEPNSTEYFAYALKCRELSELADVSTVPQINNKHISPERFPVPPRAEQLKIVNYIVVESQRFENLIEQATVGVNLLSERRSALISAAVTGKIDVRNWQTPADESAFDEEVRQAGLEAVL